MLCDHTTTPHSLFQNKTASQSEASRSWWCACVTTGYLQSLVAARVRYPASRMSALEHGLLHGGARWASRDLPIRRGAPSPIMTSDITNPSRPLGESVCSHVLLFASPRTFSDPLFLFLSGYQPKNPPSSASSLPTLDLPKTLQPRSSSSSPDGLNPRRISHFSASLFKPLLAVASSCDLACATFIHVAASDLGRPSLVDLAAPHPPIYSHQIPTQIHSPVYYPILIPSRPVSSHHGGLHA